MKRLLLAFLIIVVSLLDGWLKCIAINTFPDESTATLHPILSLALHRNPGIAFDIPIPLWFIAPLTIVVIALLVERAVRLRKTIPIVSLALLSVILGANNNLVDRLINGFTTDYLILFRTSAINLSDVLILLGSFTIVMYTERNPHALRNLIQDSPSWYGIIPRAFRSLVRFIRNPRHR
ncbi:MAG: signal peptidase II [Patescibacteria group bacterium]